MPEYVALDFNAHRLLRIAHGYGPHLNDDTGMISVVPAEIPALVASYPLFFRQNPHSGAYELGAMLGFAGNENLFIRDGQWDAGYVPLAIRCQPFAVAPSPGAAERNTLMIDVASPRVNRDSGDMLFFADGRPSERTQTAVDLLEVLVKGAAAARDYAAALDALGLIEPVELRIDQGGGRMETLAGLHGIAAERLAALTGLELGALHGRGFLAWLFLQAGSIGQVNALIRRKGQRPDR